MPSCSEPAPSKSPTAAERAAINTSSISRTVVVPESQKEYQSRSNKGGAGRKQKEEEEEEEEEDKEV